MHYNKYMTRIVVTLITLVFCLDIFAFELVIIQGISNTGQTFVTRNGKKDGVAVGMEATFTSNDVSIIAKAISVTREFTQWEINNNYTEVPFRKGEIVTYYDTKEYLWALTPEIVKQKYVKAELYSPRISLGFHTSFLRGVSESTSGSDSSTSQRGGIIFEGMVEKEFSRHYALAGGIRYSQEVINVDAASLVSTRFLSIIEGRYYFNKIQKFYNARVMLGIGFGIGQANLDTAGQSSSGQAVILPITKGALVLPVNKTADLMFEFAFESLRTDLEFEDGSNQNSDNNNVRFGIGYKRYFK